MKEKWRRIQPHLYERQGGTSRTYYVRFRCNKRGRNWSFGVGRDLLTARKLCAEILAKNALGFDFEKARQRVPCPTLGEWLAVWLERKKDKRSIKKDRYMAERLLAFFHPQQPLDLVTWEQIDDYKTRRLAQNRRPGGKPPSPATINRELALLRAVLKFAERKGKILKAPHVELLKEGEARERTVSEWEFERLLDAAAEPIRPIIRMAWHTGMRLREILNLTWRQVDLAKREIYLSGAHTKSGKARVVPIDPLVVDLEALRTTGGGKVYALDGFVFEGRRNFRKLFEAACKRADLESVTMHTFRHSFVTRKLAEGWSMKSVAEITGHSTYTMLQRYNHPSIESLHEVVGGRCNPVVTQAEKRAGRHTGSISPLYKSSPDQYPSASAPVAQMDRAQDS